MKKYVAHLMPEYLGHTLNWIYPQIKFAKKYKPYVLSQRRCNLKSYPHDLIFISRPEKKSSHMSFFERLIRRLGFMPYSDYSYFSNILKIYPPLLIQAHFGWEAYFALRLKENLNIPLVTRFYGYDVGILPRIKLWKKRYKKLFEKGDLFIVEGKNMRKRLLEIGCKSSKIVIHNLGIDLEKIPYKKRIFKKKEINVLIAASFKEKKGLEYAIKALAIAKENLKNICLNITIIGDGELKEYLHKLANDLNLNINWLGYQSHNFFIKCLYRSDLFLSPSVEAGNGDTEGGAPVAIIEASASGLPVVSTFHADIPSVIINEVTGFLVKEKDSQSLAVVIERLVKNYRLRQLLGKKGSNFIRKNFDSKVQAKKLEKIYEIFE